MTSCPSCGHELAEPVNFCPNCGASLSKLSGDTTRVIPAIVDEFQPEDLTPDDSAAIEALPPGSALLLVLKGTHAGARYLIDSDVVTAGRHPRCDIFLDDITVSRHHARFVRRDSEIWVSDENSLNGTYVNKVLVESDVLLKAGDEVQIGKFRMVFFTGQD
ncbi:MAG TPA: FHA domain-containing protein [Propionicimonas sp.]|nr:FHA domain-containing protein [Propionicimonas sp.]HRA07098.1 FHA domain-containing protein [Propionicimonas sp.]